MNSPSSDQTTGSQIPIKVRPSILADQLTDQALYQLARQYGQSALHWRRRFIGLLPEVKRRRLFERKGFSSIFEFAFKLAGLSEQQVRTALNLEKRLDGKPELKRLLETGEVSINKLVRVASIATAANEADLAEAVKILPKSTVETLVRDEKFAGKQTAAQNKNGLFKPQIEAKSMPGHDFVGKFRGDVLALNNEVTQRLLELQNKGLDLNEILTGLLDKREQDIQEEKEVIAEEILLKGRKSSEDSLTPATGKGKRSRYVPARTRAVLKAEHGKKCSISSCQKPAEQLHHTQTFALSGRHDPRYLAPLCKNHHLIAHAINLKIMEKREMVMRA